MLPKLTDRLSLGKAALEISPFCLGRVRTAETIESAFDAGINFFFLTADMHWPLYEETRRGLASLLSRRPNIRDHIVVGVVSYVPQVEFCRAPFMEVLAELPVLERIDVAIAGGAYASELSKRLPLYEDHRQKAFLGVSAIGTSFHDRQAALHAINSHLVDIAFIRYNSKHPGARLDLFPYLERSSQTLIYNFTNTYSYLHPKRCAELGLTTDYWIPSITDHYRFALTRPEIHGLLCAPGTPEEIKALAMALEKGPLDPEEEDHLLALAELSENQTNTGGWIDAPQEAKDIT